MWDIPVVVVDDQSDMRLLLRALITAENEGLRVSHEAATGLEAVEYFEAHSAAVVVMDQMMPGMTGIEAARVILERHPGMPIVLFSAFLDSRVREEAAAAGIARCVEKGEFATLAKAVRALAA